ncbi:hypothetical protein RclHR1_13550012 [Rhizophagus clarus]|uniref:Uncharacterized protein n=1 Tax=Rhizophagus clarus TaxID=94130 RepID=A0A2Z6QQ65_9GLOM|nr:hypothetical protein RclHR1_13550012 [Rhizophagus clarus]GES83181.1 hypothetical protein RCL_jg15895.t1 [Rhizophagus clarus]
MVTGNTDNIFFTDNTDNTGNIGSGIDNTGIQIDNIDNGIDIINNIITKKIYFILIGMRSDTSKLSLSDYNYIMQYKNEKSKPLNILSKKFHISNRHLYRIWKSEEVCIEAFDDINNQNETLTNSVNTPIIKTKNYFLVGDCTRAKSPIDGKEKKKNKSLCEQNSIGDCPRADVGHLSESNIQRNQFRDMIPPGISVDKNISLDAKFEKLQRGFEEEIK